MKSAPLKGKEGIAGTFLFFINVFIIDQYVLLLVDGSFRHVDILITFLLRFRY